MSDNPLEYWRYGPEAKELLLKKNAEIEGLRDQQISAVDGMLRAEQEADRKQAEIERWKYQEGLAIARCKELEAEIERLRVSLNEMETNLREWNQRIIYVATFLDGLAERLSPRELETGTQGMFDRMAADCRAMARKLRGQEST